LKPTLVGACLMAIFAIDLGLASRGLPAAGEVQGLSTMFASARHMRVVADLAGLAVAGGLYIVPVFTAVQAWAGADYRARVVAAVNVLNAAFMAVSALVVAMLQAMGWTLPSLFLLLGGCTAGVAVIISRTMPTADRLS
jgi:acyl-[acyl-carrier-protein]-phospholipid O-acyltransferase/long-chain-fatty-acid--[acyl-carrier-protein] ligase